MVVIRHLVAIRETALIPWERLLEQACLLALNFSACRTADVGLSIFKALH